MDFIGKQYRMVSSENFDEFMKALGVGIFVRKMIGSVTPTVELKKEGDWYILVTTSAVRTMEAKFQPGVEMDEKRPDGSPIKTLFEFEGNTLKQVERTSDGTEVVYIREFGPEEMTARMSAKGITCTRVYKVIN